MISQSLILKIMYLFMFNEISIKLKFFAEFTFSFILTFVVMLLVVLFIYFFSFESFFLSHPT
jgi:hypothetical protein